MNFPPQATAPDFFQLLYYNFMLSFYGPLANSSNSSQPTNLPFPLPKIEEKTQPIPPKPQQQDPEKTPEFSEKPSTDLPPKKNLIKKADHEKKHTCNCNKTNCLKLYCDCFANGELCDSECHCNGCSNCEKSSELRNQVIVNIKFKNPFAFENKYKREKSKKVNNKGCNCKRSKCLKKYCDCYLEGCFCSVNCKCEDCLNKGEEQENGERIRKMIKGNEKQQVGE